MTENLTEKAALVGIVTVFVWHGIILFLLAEPKFSRKKCVAIVGASMGAMIFCVMFCCLRSE